MATIAENLQIIKDSTDAIKQAIIDKGGDVSGDITTWASAINAIESGSGGAGSVFKITNKLNGQLFGGPTYVSTESLLHSYTFDGGELLSISLMPISTFFPAVYPSYNSVGLNPSSMRCVLLTSKSDTEASWGGIGISIDLLGNLYGEFIGNPNYASSEMLKICIIAFDTQGNYDIDYLNVQGAMVVPCFVSDTKITLSDNSYKLVQDITYNDELLVWNFDEGKYDIAKPLWIKKAQTSVYYYKITLDNGIILKLVGSNGKCHRLFSVEDGMFISATDMVGKTTYTLDGESKVLSCEIIDEMVEFYNIITNYHINLFANGVLTSCRYNNIYPIHDMKFIKSPISIEQNLIVDDALCYYYAGLRLSEQKNIPIEDTIKYCKRLRELELKK